VDAELLPPLKQTLWGRLAVANFFLGGAGAGAYLIGVFLFWGSAAPPLRAVSVLGPLLVLAGFLAVAAEAGRPLRGPRVLLRVTSSWMSRELWAGGAFVGLVALDQVWPASGVRLAAAVAALSFVLAQGFILRQCRGVAAWNVPIVPLVFVASALASGAGVVGTAIALTPVAPDRLALTTAGLLVLNGFVWTLYLSWPGDGAFRRATATLREDSAILGIFVLGHLLPLGLLLLQFRAPGLAPAAVFVAGVGILIGQLQGKAWLVLRAATLRPITMGNLRAGRPA
jgi:DMSO reductase anchor subunit